MLGKYEVKRALTEHQADGSLLLVSCEGKQFYAKVFSRNQKEVNKHEDQHENYFFKALRRIHTFFQEDSVKTSNQILMILKHENIVNVKEALLFNNSQDIALIREVFADSENLSKVSAKIQDQKIKKKIIAKLTDAMFYLHRRGIIHGNLKLKNIFIQASFKEKLLKLASENQLHENIDVKLKIREPDVLENKRQNKKSQKYYDAREIIQGGNQSQQSDIYALGIIFLELFAGKKMSEMFEEGQSFQTGFFLKIQNRVKMYVKDLKYSNLILGMLDKQPQERLTIKKIKRMIQDQDMFIWRRQSVVLNQKDGCYKGEIKDGKKNGFGLFQSVESKYWGEWKDNERCGWGIQKMSNKSIKREGDSNCIDSYEGAWERNMRNGSGVETYKDKTQVVERYEGMWKDNKREGNGRFQYKNKQIYEGEWVNNKRHGQGFKAQNNMIIYEGSWKQNEKNGAGIEYNFWNKNSRYEGEMQANKAHGKGIAYFANGDIYVGQFANHEFNGEGIYYFRNGDKYEGQLINGNRSGYGRLYFSDGSKYEGLWRDDQRNGQGQFTFADGSKHKGLRRNNKRHGNGVLSYSNGDVYEGSWVDHEFTCAGTVRYASGARYEGQFTNLQFHGRGIYYFANGSKYEGEFVKNQFNGQGTYFFENGNKQEGIFISNITQGSGLISSINREKGEAYAYFIENQSVKNIKMI